MAGGVFTFGPYTFDAKARQLRREDELVPLGHREADLLTVLLVRAGTIVTKDDLARLVWSDVAVTDNSVEQAVSGLRRALDPASGRRYIETRARQGYRFAAPVTEVPRRESDAVLDALLAPHRAWLDGRRALETLDPAEIHRARAVFTQVVGEAPALAPARVGLANACALQFEMTRADRDPDRASLADAVEHAREACRLEPGYGEAWATLGFVLERVGRREDAVAALRRAVMLEPDNWRHHLRLSYGTWGEERLRAAGRTLSLLPGLGLAHWLAATVHVARQAFGDAEREVTSGIESQDRDSGEVRRFSAVALHWLAGLLRLRAGDETGAIAAFHRELAAERQGHLYARECVANTHYAIGALHLRHARWDEAAAAFGAALERVESHGPARVGLTHALGRGRPTGEPGGADAIGSDRVVAAAVHLTLAQRHDEVPTLLARTLAEAGPGSTGWWLPIEPVLQPWQASPAWAEVLARLRARAA